jgi:hypothetical protein
MVFHDASPSRSDVFDVPSNCQLHVAIDLRVTVEAHRIDNVAARPAEQNVARIHAANLPRALDPRRPKFQELWA